MHASWAFHWCNPGALGCACLGCANHSGGLADKGVSEAEWREALKELAEGNLA
mgnify:CR=1 FL=1